MFKLCFWQFQTNQYVNKKFKFSDNKCKTEESKENKTPLIKENMHDSKFLWKYINNKEIEYLFLF